MLGTLNARTFGGRSRIIAKKLRPAMGKTGRRTLRRAVPVAAIGV
jgi:hypothetical protein